MEHVVDEIADRAHLLRRFVLREALNQEQHAVIQAVLPGDIVKVIRPIVQLV